MRSAWRDVAVWVPPDIVPSMAKRAHCRESHVAGPFQGSHLGPPGPRWFRLHTTTGAPTGRYDHTATWTGSRMIVWGGTSGSAFNTGGQYFELHLFLKN